MGCTKIGNDYLFSLFVNEYTNSPHFPTVYGGAIYPTGSIKIIIYSVIANRDKHENSYIIEAA